MFIRITIDDFTLLVFSLVIADNKIFKSVCSGAHLLSLLCFVMTLVTAKYASTNKPKIPTT